MNGGLMVSDERIAEIREYHQILQDERTLPVSVWRMRDMFTDLLAALDERDAENGRLRDRLILEAHGEFQLVEDLLTIWECDPNMRETISNDLHANCVDQHMFKTVVNRYARGLEKG